MNLKIIDNFYEINDFNFILSSAMLIRYKASWQPLDEIFGDRSNSYPCHETHRFSEEDKQFKIFIKTFEEKTGFVINNMITFFRKIYSSELENVFKYGLRPHTDPKKFDLAGVVYFNTFNLDDGTGIFSEFNGNSHIEPDVIIGSKPNRCVFYDSQINHTPLQNRNTKVRIVQPFFIKLK